MRQVLAFFVENRLLKRPDGSFASNDVAFAAGGWTRGLESAKGACLVARVAPDVEETARPVVGAVHPLPYYQGLKGLAATLPALVRGVFTAVRRARVVVVRLPGMVGLTAVLFARVLGRPVVVEVVGDIRDVLDSGVGGRVGTVLSRPAAWITAVAVRQATDVRYVTSEVLQRRYRPGPRASVFAFSDVELNEADFAFRAVEAAAPTVVAVGSQEQHYKGHDLLIRVIAQLRDEGLDVELRLLGEGRHQPALRALADELQVTDRVHFLGHVSSREQVVQEVSSAWVFAMPSRTEGLPRALLEAMALGKPCVGSDAGGIPELVRPEYVFPREDWGAMAQMLRLLLEDAGERSAVGAANRAKAAELWRVWSRARSTWQKRLEDLRQESL